MAELGRLSALCEAFAAYECRPLLGSEIECIVVLSENTPSQTDADAFWKPLRDHWVAQGLPLLRIEKERGDHQFEVVLLPSNVLSQVAYVAQIKREVTAAAHTQNISVFFTAKPFADAPANGLHLHVHLENPHGQNLFHKTEEAMSEYLRFSLGGLCAAAPDLFAAATQNEEQKQRFLDADHVPRCLGWGVNNRYAAFRIPAYEDPYHKWIETRLFSAEADPAEATTLILEAMLHGMNERLEPPAQEFGKPKQGLIGLY
jgi:glutamine synthetase